MSEDETREKISNLASKDPRIRLLSNPRRDTPTALNVGLRAAKGAYVCIMGAHACYDSDYIEVCLRELLAHDAVGCSGKIVTLPADSSLQARLVAWAMSHPFASSSRSVRTQPEGYADTVPFPVMRKQALLAIGGYNERLVRNQDNDMNQRLRAKGFKLYVTAKTQCRYYPRADIRSFLRYAFVSGAWNFWSRRENIAAMSLRHFVPMVFVVVVAVFAGVTFAGLAVPTLHPRIAFVILAALLAVHLGIGTMAGVEVSLRERTAAGLLLPALILAFHCSYGIGTLHGFVAQAPPPGLRAQRRPECSSDNT
jgi:GT2 family glycosyltransferase